MENKKVLLVALNANFHHTNLALRYFYESLSAADFDVSYLEMTINDQYDKIVEGIYNYHPSVIMFSCCIFNIEIVNKLAYTLKCVLPETIICCGGPEVSYESLEYIRENNSVDAVFRGDGDEAICIVAQMLLDKTYTESKLLTTRNRLSDYIISEKFKYLPSPYKPLGNLKHRLVYYEASRGCPFNCSYCLSSAEKSLRFVPKEKVIEDVVYLDGLGVKVIKFTDRTFNADAGRALTLFKAFSTLDLQSTLHFEICADLLTQEILEFLTTVKENLFRFEIGVQSLNEKTLSAINRRSDTKKLLDSIKFLHKNTKIHIHVDLISGLPYYTAKDLACDFNTLYHHSHQLQIGILKFLKGTKLREEAHLYNYKYNNFPPYNLLCGDDITYDEIAEIGHLSYTLQKFKESGNFNKSIDYLVSVFDTPFEMFLKLSAHFKEASREGPLSMRNMYFLLIDFAKQYDFTDDEHIKDLINADFYNKYSNLLIF